MSLSISKLTRFEAWGYRASTTYTTAQTIDSSTMTMTISCSDFPAGVFAVGDPIGIRVSGPTMEDVLITAVDDVNNTLTIQRFYPVAHASGMLIYSLGIGAFTLPQPVAGDSFTNQTGTGTGYVVRTYTSGNLETSDIEYLDFIVVSGSFTRGDHVHLSSGGSFSFGAYAPTITSPNTIMVSGSMSETDSGVDTPALDATQTDFALAGYASVPFARFIRVENEYMYVKKSYTTMRVKRGVLGSTAVAHSATKRIYVVDHNAGEQILDADVAGSWGLSTCSNGRIQLDCHILLGDPNQTSISTIIFSQESIDYSETTSNKFLTTGNSTYRTNIGIGRGYMDSGTGIYTGISSYGSVITGPNLPYGINSENTFITGPYSTIFTHDSSFCDVNFYLRGAMYARNNSVSGQTLFTFRQRTGEESKFYNSFINHGIICPISEVVDIANLFESPIGNLIGGTSDVDLYMVSAIGNITLNNFEIDAVDKSDYFAGYIASGTKSFINCKSWIGDSIYLGMGEYKHYKTFDCKVLDEAGNLLDGAQVKCNYRIASTANIFTANTVSGILPQQQVKFAETNISTGAQTLTRDIEYFITKSGYRTLRGRINIQDRDDPIKLIKVMKKNRFRESKSLPN